MTDLLSSKPHQTTTLHLFKQLKRKYFWLMQDFSYTLDAPASDTWGNLRSDPVTSQVSRGKPRRSTSALVNHDESSTGLPIHLTRYSSYVLFLVLLPTRLSNISSISFVYEVAAGIPHCTSATSSSSPPS